MDPIYWALLAGLVILGIVIGGAVVWLLQRRRKAGHLRERFGAEYDRAIEKTGDRQSAEYELLRRKERVKTFDIRPLSPEQRSGFAESWRNVQARFVDTPARAVAEADHLVSDVMQARGYPMGEFEQRAEDLSVDHASVVENFRTAHALALRNHRGDDETEDLRLAMVHYRTLFEDLLETPVTDGRTSQKHEERLRG